MHFEREVIQEIWRTSYCTLNVVYLTPELACIKGLRGSFSIKDYKSILGIFSRNGYTKLIIERTRSGVIEVEEVILKDRYKKYKGSEFKRGSNAVTKTLQERMD